MYLYSNFGGLSRRGFATGVLHSMCGHTYKLFEISSAPIAIFSEQTQKHCKKCVVMYRSGCDTRTKVMYKSGCDTRARQHSIRESLHGILSHMLRLRNALVLTDVAKSNVVSVVAWVMELGQNFIVVLVLSLVKIIHQIMALYCSSQ